MYLLFIFPGYCFSLLIVFDAFYKSFVSAAKTPRHEERVIKISFVALCLCGKYILI